MTETVKYYFFLTSQGYYNYAIGSSEKEAKEQVPLRKCESILVWTEVDKVTCEKLLEMAFEWRYEIRYLRNCLYKKW